LQAFVFLTKGERNMSKQAKNMTAQEIIERKIFLKRQAIQLIMMDIEELEAQLREIKTKKDTTK